MVTELKPCPFCGGAIIIEGNEEVWCDYCGVLTSATDWNTRPIEDALRVQLEKVEDILREIIAAFKAKAGGEPKEGCGFNVGLGEEPWLNCYYGKDWEP